VNGYTINHARVAFAADRNRITVSEGLIQSFPAELRFSGEATGLSSARVAFAGKASVSRLEMTKLLELSQRKLDVTGTMSGEFNFSGAYLPEAPAGAQRFVDMSASGSLTLEDATAFGYPVSETTAKITYANEPGAKFYGTTVRDIVGKKFSESFGQEATTQESSLAKCLRTGEAASNFEADITMKNGNKVWVRGNTAPIRDVNGKVIGALELLLNITAAKQAQQKIDEANKQEEHAGKLEKLENRAGARVAPNIEQQRHWAEEQAAAAKRALLGLQARHELVEFSASFIEGKPRERLHFAQVYAVTGASLKLLGLLLLGVVMLAVLVALIASPWWVRGLLRRKE
jgi:PAS domain S-box-containing protein